MGILQLYTFNRSALRATELESASMVSEYLDLASHPDAARVKLDINVLAAMRNSLGVLRRDGDGLLHPTEVGVSFHQMYSQNPRDAWQWLLTRALWKNVVPNGANAGVNRAAKEAGITFNFFRTMLQGLMAMSSRESDRRFIYYDELVPFLSDDANWGLDGIELFRQLSEAREQGDWRELGKRRGLLDDLEDEFEAPRDNLNTVLRKAMGQTGLFEYQRRERVDVGIALRTELDPFLQKRIRHMLDFNPVWKAE